MSYLKFLFSTRLTAILFLLFPTAMAIGTFVESIYNTTTARILIYNAWWFELIMCMFFINFIGNIKKYKLLRKDRIAVLGLHLSFIFILLGAFVTRYIGYEGVMPIREGATESTFLSEKTYLTVFVDGEIEGKPLRRKLQKNVLLSEFTPNKNQFSLNYKYGDKPFKISYKKYQENVSEDLLLDAKGDRYLKLVIANEGKRENYFLKEGEVTPVKNVLFSLNNPLDNAINIKVENGIYTISSPFEGNYLRMADQKKGEVQANVFQPLELRSLYTMANLNFVLPTPLLRGKIGYTKNNVEETTDNALTLTISYNGITDSLTVIGGKGTVFPPNKIRVGDLDFSVQYGSIPLLLPFKIKLNDFIATKYPGTEKSYSSFKSKVSVIDDQSYDYDIFMNHILSHKGYRFYQSSFDPDEKGTILSVNNDFFGTLFTYIGYFLLYFSLIGVFFIGKTRFKNLSTKLKKIRKNKSKYLLPILFLFSWGLFSQTNTPAHNFQNDSVLQKIHIDTKHASKFGEIVLQDSQGRMKPINTFSSELLRKVSKKDTYKELNSDQVLLSILLHPNIWYTTPIIYLKRGNDSIRNLIGVPKKAKHAALLSFFDGEGNYKIASQLEEAYRAGVPNQFQKDFIELDRRINLFYSALEGKIFRIFPVPNDTNNKWVSYHEIQENRNTFKGMDSLYVHNILPIYAETFSKPQVDYTKADGIIESIKGFQKKHGENVLPSVKKIKAEIAYNKINIFNKLYKWYLYISLILITLGFIFIFNQKKIISYLVKIGYVIVILLFFMHTIGLVARGYISNHAPWSNAYESMIYVAWALLLFGLIFGRKSTLTVAGASFVASITLMVAHWNWLDPSISNLQPVLDSYWLMIHVAIIVASYGPFALGKIIGLMTLLMIIFSRKKNNESINLHIKELTIINELTLTVGLVMLVIGNFLGGMWANESWGRYWGWDPKETWALISIMVYAFVLHMRIIPGLKSLWAFNMMSVIAFASILMTYFGVNFYLVGLHSYASGDKVITPTFIYYYVIIEIIIGVLSYLKYKKLKSNIK